MEFAVVTGHSGAGRSQAANFLEDLGWFVIDNLPAALLPKVSELAGVAGTRYDRVALVSGSGEDAEELTSAIRALREADDSRIRVIFLQASTPVLVRRYESTKRPHPWDPSLPLVEAIETERAALEVIKAEADMVIDTSNTSVHQLRDRVEGEFATETDTTSMSVRLVSFGYKHGLPLDVDLVMDCRFLPNPHWVDELRPLTGRDPEVAAYIQSQTITPEFLERLYGLIDLLMPAYEREGKSYLSIGIGCTGGQHRSVWVAGQLRGHLEEQGYSPRVSHRDVDRSS
ncbi:MAG: RNase adapter RapZ [Acidimicrobiales bacterium]